MTSHTPKPTPRKRLLLYTIVSTVILVAAWVSYFLINFDLNNYRQHAEEELSSLLSLSVKIGKVHYSFHDTNLALRVTDLQIGDHEDKREQVVQSVHEWRRYNDENKTANEWQLHREWLDETALRFPPSIPPCEVKRYI